MLGPLLAKLERIAERYREAEASGLREEMAFRAREGEALVYEIRKVAERFGWTGDVEAVFATLPWRGQRAPEQRVASQWDREGVGWPEPAAAGPELSRLEAAPARVGGDGQARADDSEADGSACASRETRRTARGRATGRLGNGSLSAGIASTADGWARDSGAEAAHSGADGAPSIGTAQRGSGIARRGAGARRSADGAAVERGDGQRSGVASDPHASARAPDCDSTAGDGSAAGWVAWALVRSGVDGAASAEGGAGESSSAGSLAVESDGTASDGGVLSQALPGVAAGGPAPAALDAVDAAAVSRTAWDGGALALDSTGPAGPGRPVVGIRARRTVVGGGVILLPRYDRSRLVAFLTKGDR